MYYVYILECRGSLFYTGITWDLSKRLREHREGKGSLFTKCHLPVRLVYFEKLYSKRAAALRKKIIKDMNQSKKRKLVEKFTSSFNEKRV